MLPHKLPNKPSFILGTMYKNPKFSKYSILQIQQRFPGKISLIRFKLKRSSVYLERAFNLNSMNYSQTTDTYHFLEINTLTQIHTTIRGCLHDFVPSWKKNSVYISFHCGRNEMKLIFVLIFWSTIFVFMKYSHAQMFPFEWFHLKVVFT